MQKSSPAGEPQKKKDKNYKEYSVVAIQPSHKEDGVLATLTLKTKIEFELATLRLMDIIGRWQGRPHTLLPFPNAIC